MATRSPRPSWGASQELTDRVLLTLERFLHIEAVSGGVLIVAAAFALLWANSPAADAYHALWHASVTFEVVGISTTQTTHFLVNEGLMTIFFLVAGLEIRRELHEGALSNPRLAALPLAAALGGVVAPALIYLAFNPEVDLRRGWAVPIATDIAFALGVLALLGRSIPRGVRVLLLALAIIDDIVAVVIVATVYSAELQVEGAAFAALALVIVVLFQRLGIRAAIAYVVPGSILWYGFWQLGVHPTLAGVVLGLLTPVAPLADRKRVQMFTTWLQDVAQRVRARDLDGEELVSSLRRIQSAQRHLIPPVVTVQTALHPWVAYGILPLFAFANAGVTITATSVATEAPWSIFYGISVGLLLGKPLGILLASAATVRFGWCELPADVGWRGIGLVALLGGIGFTMAIFIANLAFDSASTLAIAKISILLASFASAVLALVAGRLSFGRGGSNRTGVQRNGGARGEVT